jgi:hypothetical protein
MSVDGWGVWSEQGCRLAERQMPTQSAGGLFESRTDPPAKPRSPRATTIRDGAAWMARAPGALRTIRAPQTPRAFRESFYTMGVMVAISHRVLRGASCAIAIAVAIPR